MGTWFQNLKSKPFKWYQSKYDPPSPFWDICLQSYYVIIKIFILYYLWLVQILIWTFTFQTWYLHFTLKNDWKQSLQQIFFLKNIQLANYHTCSNQVPSLSTYSGLVFTTVFFYILDQTNSRVEVLWIISSKICFLDNVTMLILQQVCHNRKAKSDLCIMQSGIFLNLKVSVAWPAQKHRIQEYSWLGPFVAFHNT